MKTGIQGAFVDPFFQYVLNQYKDANERARAKGMPEPGIPILTQASYRLEQFINATSTFYRFPLQVGEVGQGSTSVLPTETRLELNDNLHVESIGFYIAQTVASTDTDFRLHTYPNEIELGAAAAVNYHNIYNGTLNIKVNQTEVLTNYRLSKHYYVPQTQRLSVAAASNRDEINLEEDGLLPLRPSIMLSGANTNAITISIPSAVTLALAANNSRMVIIFDGLRAQNAAIRK